MRLAVKDSACHHIYTYIHFFFNALNSDIQLLLSDDHSRERTVLWYVSCKPACPISRYIMFVSPTNYNIVSHLRVVFSVEYYENFKQKRHVERDRAFPSKQVLFFCTLCISIVVIRVYTYYLSNSNFHYHQIFL